MDNKPTGAVPSMILGLISVILSFIVGLLAPYIPLILGIIGLVLAVNANKVAKSGMGTAGFVLSIIGIVLSGIYMILWIACAGIIGAAVDGALSSVGHLF